MRLDREARPGGPIVTGFSAGGFKVEEQAFRALVLSPERFAEWTPPPLAQLTPAAVEELLTLEPAPEFLLLGTGPTLARPPLAFTAALEGRGIGVEAMDSRAAARAWGVLRGEGRWIAAALYPLS
ncbi:MAG TPA: MTH938/NDUFAF3 family protein [Sphingomonas sp.]|nr:MTH938/NDUFAF3 family protein [Sphingomonas sp.]